MWSTVILSSGLMLLIGCALTGTILIRSQIRSRATGFGMLATSDSVLNTAIGATLIGQAIYKEDAKMKTSCSQTMVLISASTFFLSFASSFISMLIMATECYAAKKMDKDKDKSEGKVQKMKTKRLTVEIGLQWTLPILLIAILHQVVPTIYMEAGFRQAIANDTCQVTKLFSEQISSECHDEIMAGEENTKTNNITVHVVKHIYELLSGNSDQSDSRAESTVNLYPPQTKDEWKDTFMHMSLEGPENNKNKHFSATRNAIVCDESCVLSFKRLQTNLLVLMLLTYFIPMIGTMILHYLSKNTNMQQQAKSTADSEKANYENLSKKVCHLKEMKFIALSNLLMWTPVIVERLAQKLLCSNPPPWIEAMLYIIGQMNTVIRGLINANAANSKNLLNKNIVVPLEPQPDCGAKDLTSCSTEMREVLFQKRMK